MTLSPQHSMPTTPWTPLSAPGSAWPSDPAFRVEGRLEGRRHVPLRGAGRQFEPWAEIVAAGSLVQRSGATGRFTVDVARAHVYACPDGRRTLVDDQGHRLTIEPTLWSDGRRLVEDIDRAADPRLTFSMPAREPASVPAPLSQGVTTNRWVRFGAGFAVFLLVFVGGRLTIDSLYRPTTRPTASGATTRTPEPGSTAITPATAAASPSGRGSPAVAVHRFRYPGVAFNLPDTWSVKEAGVDLVASGPASSDQILLITSIDLTAEQDFRELQRRHSHYRRCTYVGAPTDIVIDAHRTDVVDCSFVGKHERRIASRIGYRITEILYWGPTPPDESTGLQLVQKSMVVHSGVVSRPALSGKAATGTVMKSAGFSLAAPAGWTQIAQPTSLNARAAGLTPAPVGDAVLGFFTSDAGDGLMVTHHEDPSGLSPFFSTVDHIEAARAADHLSGTVTGVNVNGRLSYVFEDQDPQGRPGFVLISPLGEGYLTVSTRSSTKDKAWDQLVAVVSSLS